MTNTNTYHLPDNAYWSCSNKYNGLSRKDKAQPAMERIISTTKQVGVLKNKKISSTILKQLL